MKGSGSELVDRQRYRSAAVVRSGARLVGLGTHQQHGHRCGADDLLGVAADEQAPDTAPAVRADDDEVGVPELGLGDDDVADAAAERFRQEGVDRNAVRFDTRLGLASGSGRPHR